MKSLCRWKSEKMADTYTRKTERLKSEASKTLLKKTANVRGNLSNADKENVDESATKR